MLAFLAGPPDYGRGAVLRPPAQLLPSAPSGPALFDPTFPDVNPYAFVPMAAASGRDSGGAGAAASPDEGEGESAQVQFFGTGSQSWKPAGRLACMQKGVKSVSELWLCRCLRSLSSATHLRDQHPVAALTGDNKVAK